MTGKVIDFDRYKLGRTKQVPRNTEAEETPNPILSQLSDQSLRDLITLYKARDQQDET